jgi:hypothetical protein
MDFRDAVNIVTAEITPQPWDYTAPDGTTLTVIPRGWPADPGDAEVLIRITAPNASGLTSFNTTTVHTRGVAQFSLTTTRLPALIDALRQRTGWEDDGEVDDDLTMVPDATGVTVTVVEAHRDGKARVTVTESVHLPEVQRLPLTSALSRALDVARGWES